MSKRMDGFMRLLGWGGTPLPFRCRSNDLIQENLHFKVLRKEADAVGGRINMGPHRYTPLDFYVNISKGPIPKATWDVVEQLWIRQGSYFAENPERLEEWDLLPPIPGEDDFYIAERVCRRDQWYTIADGEVNGVPYTTDNFGYADPQHDIVLWAKYSGMDQWSKGVRNLVGAFQLFAHAANNPSAVAEVKPYLAAVRSYFSNFEQRGNPSEEPFAAAEATLNGLAPGDLNAEETIRAISYLGNVESDDSFAQALITWMYVQKCRKDGGDSCDAAKYHLGLITKNEAEAVSKHEEMDPEGFLARGILIDYVLLMAPIFL